MDKPTVNISTTGLVPTHTDKFRLFFPCTGKVAAPVTKSVPTKSVLLSSVSPSMFVTLGAASTSVILLTIILASLYIRRVRKRDSQLAAGSSLRSSLQLNSEEEYTEKQTAK